jgi:hypothetical protein
MTEVGKVRARWSDDVGASVTLYKLQCVATCVLGMRDDIREMREL